MTLFGLPAKVKGMTRKSIPKPSFLDDCEYLGHKHGERRWRSLDKKRIFTWDAFHGEIEAFTARGFHLGAVDALTGIAIKPPVAGRTIDV